jgi:acetyl esterase
METMDDTTTGSDGSSVDEPAPKARRARSGSGATKAKPATKATAAKATATRAPARKRGAKAGTSEATTGPLEDPSGRRSWGRSRSRALYNRRIQEAYEHWPVVTRLLTGLFSHPEAVLAALGSREPVEVEGRVLNRGVQAVLEVSGRLPGFNRDPDLWDPQAMRSDLDRVSRLAMPVRTDVHVTGRVIRHGPESPGIPIRIYRQYGTGIGAGPSDRKRPPALVFFHGGGWVTGGLDSHDALCRLLAAVSRCIVVAVDYRLAPEAPYPAAVDDALAAYAWVHRHSDEVGHADGQVGVVGDSAGGNLAAVVALETRPDQGSGDLDVPPPVAQGLIYPALDARLDSASNRTMAEGFFLTRESMENFRASYLPDRSDWETGRVSPLLADDHHGLAPALVVTAGFDPLRDDGAHYSEVLAKSGVEVEYRCYDDQVHGFMSMGFLPDSLALATEVCEAMGQLMRRSATAEAEE